MCQDKKLRQGRMLSAHSSPRVVAAGITHSAHGAAENRLTNWQGSGRSPTLRHFLIGACWPDLRERREPKYRLSQRKR
jgi:hypothetical protein